MEKDKDEIISELREHIKHLQRDINKKEFIDDMSTLKEIYKKKDKIFEVIGFDNEVSDVLDEQETFIVNLLKDKYLDCYDWIGWFIYENYFGKSGYEAGYNDNLKKIKTLNDLWRLINDFKKENKINEKG